MKNIRKIVAILAAVLMLCSVVPFSFAVSAADGDVVWSVDFNDGTAAFTPSEIVAEGPDGSNCMKWAANGGWSATYAVVKDMDSSKDYTITMKAKGSVAGGMGITIQNGDWGSYWNGPTFNVSTEWDEIVIALPAGEIPFAPGTILFKFQDVGVAMDLYVDDIVISEGLPKLPIITNGDFEEGNVAPWTVHQQVTVEAGAAYEGNYGAHLKDNGTWGGIMDTTLAVTAGKSYELSFWIKVNKFGLNLQIKDGSATGASLATGTWYDYNNHSEWTQKVYVVTPTTDAIFLNFCGGGDGTPDPAKETDTYIDNIKVRELKDPSFDGYITNGDFETGDSQSWESVWGAAQLTMIEGGHNSDYALKVDAGQWQVTRQVVNVEPNTDYVVHVYAKNASKMTLLTKSCPADQNIAQAAINGGDEWTQNSLVFNSGDNTQVYVCVMGNEAGSTAIVDDFFMFKKVSESNDGYIVNGTFETGALTPWENLWGSCPKAEIVRGGKDDNFALDIVSGQWKHVRQTDIAVEANTDYKISVWAKNVKNMNLLVKDNGDSTNIVNQGVSAGNEWTLFEAQFNSGDYTAILVSFMGGDAEAYGTFDNIVMEKLAPACEHEYFSPCDQHCMICGELTNPEASHNIVHVEAVEPTCTTMGNLEYWYCDVCGAAWLDEACTLNTNMMAVKLPAGHTFDYECSTTCSVCWEENLREASHNLIHHAAVEPIDCAHPGNIEYYECEYCGETFSDAEGVNPQNPWYIQITVDCVRPEGVADCATWTCETCGTENYGAGEHDTGVPACQDGHCSKCGETVEGYGHQNYDGPACLPGNCYYCGEAMEPVPHENGAWAPCLEGECAYGCGLTYPATAEHVDDDANDYCDVCYNHLNHIDEDSDNWCDICWSEIPAEPEEIIYGDADGDGEVTLTDAALLGQWLAGYDVTVNEAAADADGDGEITLTDAALLGQWLAGYDVTLGPVEDAPLFNDVELGGW